MKFGGIGVPELIIILVVVLLIFGPKNLPKLGSALGKTVKNLRSGMEEGGDLEEAADDELEVVQDDVADERPVKKSTSGEGARKKKRPASEAEAPKKRPKRPAEEDEDLLSDEA